ncbi:MAG: 4-hydroxy-tetrahydrodipicolinate reductase [Flammeovirgaceae bacterium]|jgi:4-hydroxy-tetrahydrodipicolinate reductase|nr:4-hydroxy-tetrahydrodipicolinate reductase [Flammeovirgaceae bacterium]|tara:strand:+ start:25489 stop:26202 length:714 start_codon:yes stop_codon:yes gene_type:complete
MKIGLIGYGKMGQAIEAIAKKRGHVISKIIDLKNMEELSQLTPNNTDVVIEFSTPQTAFNNISNCLEQGLPIISGTTGWLDQLPVVEALCRQKNGTFLSTTNFSLGVNIFLKLNEWLTKVMDQQPQYEVDIEEIHHLQKLDRPSGTAITLAYDIIKDHSKYENWSLDEIHSQTIKINSLRKPEVPGTHRVVYESTIDKIEIKHEAYSRAGFAEGAVLVAEWIQHKKGVLTMNDFINL